MSIHLVIPDSHSSPEVSNERYTWLGRLIADLRPDVVVNLGDHADMASLCSYDVGKKSFEGRRYKRDIAHVHDSLERLHRPLWAVRKKYRPKMYLALGNHEDRISRAIEADAAKLDGVISLKDLGYEEYGWKVHPYRVPFTVDGVTYCHYFGSGIMGRPIGGEHSAHSLVSKLHCSATAGHSHVRDFSERTRPDGSRVLGLVAGCYFSHHSDFAGPANNLYWRGVVIKRAVKDGNYSHQWLSLEEIKRAYG